MKATDSGRKVFGGGGITPDEKYAHSEAEHLPAPHGTAGCSRTGSTVSRTPTSATRSRRCPSAGRPDDATMDALQAVPEGPAGHLHRRRVQRESRVAASGRIRCEFYFRAFDKNDRQPRPVGGRPEVKKGIESLPEGAVAAEPGRKSLRDAEIACSCDKYNRLVLQPQQMRALRAKSCATSTGASS